MLIDIKYVECPHCKSWYSTTELLSYSGFGSNAECWSDGKCINANISEYSFMPFVRCENCKNFFWIDECSQATRTELLKKNQGKFSEAEIPQIDYPPPHYWFNLPISFISDLIEILNSQELSTQNEIYIRTKLWQHINDFKRNNKIKNFRQITRLIKNKKNFLKYKKTHLANMKKLSELIEKSNDTIEKFSMLVELYRELGDFKKSKSIIDCADPAEIQYNKEFVNKSKKMITKRSKQIFKI